MGSCPLFLLLLVLPLFLPFFLSFFSVSFYLSLTREKERNRDSQMREREKEREGGRERELFIIDIYLSEEEVALMKYLLRSLSFFFFSLAKGRRRLRSLRDI